LTNAHQVQIDTTHNLVLFRHIKPRHS